MKFVVSKVDGFGFGFGIFFMLPFDTIIVISLMCMGFNEWRKVCNFYGVIRVHFKL